MEEQDHERCSVIYYCASAGDDVHELFHHQNPPTTASGVRHENASLDSVYRNVEALLDEYQGGFHEVFVSSRAETCVARLETYANSVPTAVLIELESAVEDGSPVLVPEKKNTSFSFLRALSADIHGARYQRQVMPFALIAPGANEVIATLNAETTESCLTAGAIDVVHSPLGDEDLNRLVGHVKEATRPDARFVGADMAHNLVDSIRATAPTDVAAHRPDQKVSPERRAAVEEAVAQWHFPAQDLSMDELTYAALYMLEHILQVPELEQYRISRPELMTFLLATRRQYKHQRVVHYHNWRHAVDVTQSLFCFLLDVRICPPLPSDNQPPKQLKPIEKLLTPLDGLILLTSAVGHDVGHPGVNNAFLVACSHPLAQMYNDKSVLENYHCAAYSQLIRRHWPALGNAAGFRPTMISTILATDMQRHFEYMGNLGELKRKVESSESDLSDWSDKDREHARELIMALMMKAADISNVARPFDISALWARILMNEFSRQGELESELELPTCLFGGPPNKEDILAAAQSQKGFMSLFGVPLFSGISEVIPSVSCAIRELEQNQEIWDQKISQEKQRRDSNGKSAPLTFSSVSKDEVEEAQNQKHSSEPLAVPETGLQSPSTPTKRQAVNESALSPKSHPAHQARQHYIRGYGQADERSSAPNLPAPLSPNGCASRRSSKDVALDSLQQLSAFTHNALSVGGGNAGSRRGSADASWQIHQSYPGSRRGSKDESLTTILVTSQGSPGRISPSSPGRTPRPTGSPGKQSRKRQSVNGPPRQDGATSRYSIPSSRSHTTSSATATTTTQHSPSTQPSSLAPTDDEPTPPANNIASTEDPFVTPGHLPENIDGGMDGTHGMHHASSPAVLPASPGVGGKAEPPKVVARMASGESEDASSGRGTPRKERGGIRESRSRSRLRGLKFWKKRRDVSGMGEGASGEAGSP